MSYIYVTEQGSSLYFRENKIICENPEKEVKEVPVEVTEGIVIFGNISLTTPFIQEMLKRDIPVTFLSSTGSFFGKLESTTQTNIVKQAHQFKILYDKEFCLNLAKKIIDGKINNQLVILRRYNRNHKSEENEKDIKRIVMFRERIPEAETMEGLIGFEGMCSRHYFSALGRMVPKEFSFFGRSKRPPKDPFNSILSLGYTLLIYEVYNLLISSGLSPYLGFFHKVRNHHPALASDLMEELRAPLIDSLCMSVISKGILNIEDFTVDKEHKGVFINKKAIKTFISKYEEKIRTNNEYYNFNNNDEELSYRKALSKQIISYYHAIEQKDLNLYNPLKIR